MQVTSSDKHSGSHSVQITNRFKYFDGLAQTIHVTPGQYYHVSAWVKFLNDHPKQNIGIHMEFTFPDGKHEYPSAALHNLAVSSDGWFHLVGGFTAPDTALQKSRLYFQSGPSEQVKYAVDDVSVVPQTNQNVSRAYLDQMIDKQRKSNIKIQVHTASGINLADVQIHVLQKKKLFPFGTAVRGSKYNYNVAGGRYGDFIHKHFNWAVPENSLKWPAIEPTRGKKNFQRPLDMIHRLKSQG
ncbi:hypothetical protein V1264_024344 [Littorina saxatilis]|uniref:Uncharacterized protein n=2 Tax=Littorina saxatilis TaxID=31220 RepID=A0AAN9AMS8_9CAEN